MTKAALLLAMVSGFMLAAGAANAATLPKGSHKDLPCATCHKGGDTTKKPTSGFPYRETRGNAWRAMVPITISPSALRN